MSEYARSTGTNCRRPTRGGVLVWWLPLLLGLLLPGLAAAQQRSTTELEVVIAALPYLRGSLAEAKVTFDPEPFCDARLVGWTCPQPLRAVADSLGLRLNSRSFTHVCLGGTSGCRLVGAAALIVLGRPLVDGSTATVEASVWRRAGRRPSPVEQRHIRLRLARKGGEWEVVGEEPFPDG